MYRIRSAAVGAIALAALAGCSDVPAGPADVGPPPQEALFSSTGGADPVVPGEVLVKMKEGADVDALARAHGLAKGRAGYGNAFVVLHTARGNERAMAATLSAQPGVEFAEANYLRKPLSAGPRLWAFHNPGGLNTKFNEKDSNGRYGQTLPSTYASYADADMDANFTVACQQAVCTDIVIGNIDTGVDFSNPELAGRLIAGGDWFDNDADPSDIATEGHGTHTAGTSAGLNTSAVGVTGIAAHVKFWVGRVCGTGGCPTSAIVNAMNAAADYRDANGKPMVALNVSLGGGSLSTGEQQAIQKLTNNGTLVIASAGNDGMAQVSCPACDANAISVAALNWQDAHTYYTNYGRGLDLSANGGELYSNTTEESGIFSSVVAGYTAGTGLNTYCATCTADPIYSVTTDLPRQDANYAYMQGTSMAAPNVTSAAAVVAWSTGLRGAALRDRLQKTADDKGKRGVDNNFGYGRVNVYRAVHNTATSPI